MNKWDIRMLDLAALIATWSKDPSTGVGAVIVDPQNRVVSMGYNGFPRAVDDSQEALLDRDEKLRRTIHAEDNALLFAKRDVTGCTIYTTHPPCARCAAKVIQAGITRVVTPEAGADFAARWADDTASAAAMFAEAGVVVDACRAERGERPTDAMLDAMRRSGLSIDGDNKYKRDLIDTIIGTLMLGKQGSSPPPAGHWAEQFWEMARAEGELQERLAAQGGTQ